MTRAPVLASCSVVAYANPPEQIERLLRGVSGSWPRLLTYLIENSPEDSLRSLAPRYQALYWHQPDNPGFGRSHNRAMRAAMEAGSRYHFVLNPDIYFSEDSFSRLLAYMESQADVAMLSPRICFPDGRLQPLCKLLPAPIGLAPRRFLPWLHRCTGLQRDYEMHASGYDRIMDVPVLSGCFMLIRTDALARAGLFDKRFFLYFEDVDLSRRLARVGRTVFYPHVTVMHEYGRGSYRDWRLLCHHSASAVRYFNKWGWWFDEERERVNARALGSISLAKGEGGVGIDAAGDVAP
ncbi:glycosyltransferase [Massilia varians]